MEYFMRDQYGLPVLARRLRERFPDAVLVFVRLWYPLEVVSTKNLGTVRDWAKRSKHERLHSDSFKEAVLGTERGDWQYVPMTTQIKIQEQAIEDLGGYLYELPMPEDPRQALAEHADWFNERDWHHLSADGHAEVARGVRAVVEGAIEEKRAQLAREGKGGEMPEPRLGTWGAGLDVCHSWFQSGDVALPFSDNLNLNRFVNGTVQKWALEFPYPDGGTLALTNPANVSLDLYLRFMIMGPPPSLYPPCEVSVGGRVVVEELDTSQNLETHHVNVAQTVRVGTIPPGASELRLRPLEVREYRGCGYGRRGCLQRGGERHHERAEGSELHENAQGTLRRGTVGGTAPLPALE